MNFCLPAFPPSCLALSALSALSALDAYQFISKPIELQPLLHLLGEVNEAPAVEAAPSIVVLSARAGWVELVLPCTQEVADRIEGYVANLETDLPDDIRAGMVFKELLLDAMGGEGHFD